jgi:hypothetical protein
LIRKKTRHLNTQSWKFVFRLPAIGEVCGEILFRLRVLNSVWILALAFEIKDRLVATGVSGALQQGFCGVSFYYVVGLVLPHFV